MSSYQVTLDIEATIDVINERLTKLEENQKSILNIIHIMDNKIYELKRLYSHIK